jgi:hypothetical protein
MLKRITQTATRFTVPSPSVILPFHPIPIPQTVILRGAGCPRHGVCAWVFGSSSLRESLCPPRCPFFSFVATWACHPDRSAALYAAPSGGIAAHSHDLARLPLPFFSFLCPPRCPFFSFVATWACHPDRSAAPFAGRHIVIPTGVPRRC